ncbi:MAG: hypothetical protein VR70_05210 [Rhodospirillaceae bacterium BRH_c57]|nr:MAG: hypothetical protein VR70_05210 [Rhodospirillaceae bacterium BRH_c57]
MALDPPFEFIFNLLNPRLEVGSTGLICLPIILINGISSSRQGLADDVAKVEGQGGERASAWSAIMGNGRGKPRAFATCQSGYIPLIGGRAKFLKIFS